MVQRSKDRDILNYFERVSIELRLDGVIHGRPNFRIIANLRE